MNTQILFAFGLIVSILGWTLISVSDLKADMKLLKYQVLSGAIIICLGFWTFRTDRLNRAMQKENFDKLAVISVECSSHMASVSARLENLEREVEASKQLEMIQASRKG